MGLTSRHQKAVNGHYRSFSGSTAVDSPTKESFSPPIIKIKKQSFSHKKGPYGPGNEPKEAAPAQHGLGDAKEASSTDTVAIKEVQQELDTSSNKLKDMQGINDGLLYALQSMQQELDDVASKGAQNIISEQEEMLSAANAENVNLREEVSDLKYQLSLRTEQIAGGSAYIKSREREWRLVSELKKLWKKKPGQDDAMLDLLEEFNEEIVDLQAQLDGRIDGFSAMHRQWLRIQKAMADMNNDTIEALQAMNESLDDVANLRAEVYTLHQAHNRLVDDFNRLIQNHGALQHNYNYLLYDFNNEKRRVETLLEGNSCLRDRKVTLVGQNASLKAENVELGKVKQELENKLAMIWYELGNFGGRAFHRVIHLAMQLEQLGLEVTNQEHEELSIFARNYLKIDETMILQDMSLKGENLSHEVSADLESPYSRGKRLVEEKEAEMFEKTGLRFEESSGAFQKSSKHSNIELDSSMVHDGIHESSRTARTSRKASFEHHQIGSSYLNQGRLNIEEHCTPQKNRLANPDDVTPARVGGTSGISRSDFQEATDDILSIAQPMKRRSGLTVVSQPTKAAERESQSLSSLATLGGSFLDSKREHAPKGTAASKIDTGDKSTNQLGDVTFDNVLNKEDSGANRSESLLPAEAIDKVTYQEVKFSDDISKGEVMDEVISLDISKMGQKDVDHASLIHSRNAAAASPVNKSGERTPVHSMETVEIESSTTSLRRLQAFDFGAGFKKIALPEKKTPSPGVAKTKSSTELGSTNDASTTTSMEPSRPFAPEDFTSTFDAGASPIAAAHDPALSPSAAAHQAAPDTAYVWSSDIVKQDIDTTAQKQMDIERAKEAKKDASKRHREAERAATAAESVDAGKAVAEITSAGRSRQQLRAAGREKMKEMKKLKKTSQV